ncbi:MAG: hypothetical protein MI861_20500, partial [Pirellulales bacterium]|nr:hypothetical protein [Pirellulales bacterium]
MPLLLTVHQASASTRRLLLRAGQEARVGRSEWTEMSLPEDPTLADEHFVVRCSTEALVEVIDPNHTLVFQGNPLQRLELSRLADQSAEFVAGQTTFLVNWSAELNS